MGKCKKCGQTDDIYEESGLCRKCEIERREALIDKASEEHGEPAVM